LDANCAAVILLDMTHSQLGWPSTDDVLEPPGPGTRVFVELAQEKIQRELRRISGDAAARVGVLASNPASKMSEPPLALVCVFTRAMVPEVLATAHKLAWNFCHCPMLITLEPHLLRMWDSCQPPVAAPEDAPLFNTLVESNRAQVLSESIENGKLSQKAVQTLNWMNLASGQFVREQQPKGYFRREGRADYLLLKNLKALRRRLTAPERGKEPPGGVLPEAVCHDLLARLIFVEFLFQRKDSEGGTALNARKLATLYENRTLLTKHSTLVQILRNHEDTYRFFRWLNGQFNGDLFPPDDARPSGAPSLLEAEKAQVKKEHLAQFADFIEGRLDEQTDDRFLWSQYCFDVIPLEFISSVYEDFVGRGKGVHYTPLHLVDFVLDRVLPWGGEGWDFRVLDPACGSGIFLVKTFQRLVHRWRASNNGAQPEASLLRQILEKNLLGVDINAEAVRVAAFSLYLAMCDEIDPRKVWTTVKFPPLNNQRLLAADFFSESDPKFCTREDERSFDFVVGNAPWGKRTTTEMAEDWADTNGWPVANLDIGPLFLAKALAVLEEGGKLAMIEPLGALLLNDTENARNFRTKLFALAQAHEVVNLSTLRFDIFENAIWPCCIVYLENRVPDQRSIAYISPKGGFKTDGSFRLRIEPPDIHHIRPAEAVSEPVVWTALIWGQRRDLALLRRLREVPSIAARKKSGELAIREGVIRGNRERHQEFLVGKRWLRRSDFPKNPLEPIRAGTLQINFDDETDKDASRDFAAFALPQLIIKQSWHQPSNRFQAALVESTPEIGPVLCPDSYVSTTSNDPAICQSVWAMLNSQLAVYFLLLTSGQFAAGIPKPLEKEMRALPIPDADKVDLSNIKNLEQLDKLIRRAFGLNEAQRALVEDLFHVTLRDFKGAQNSPGRLITTRLVRDKKGSREEPELALYCDYFLRALRAAFGGDKAVSTTIFQETAGEKLLPLRMVAIHFDLLTEPVVRVETLQSEELRGEIERLDAEEQERSSQGSVYTRSVVRCYTTTKHQSRTVPTVFLLKPDQCRYWTRTAALHDADAVIVDFRSSQQKADPEALESAVKSTHAAT
jgi:hypothetical protein